MGDEVRDDVTSVALALTAHRLGMPDDAQWIRIRSTGPIRKSDPTTVLTVDRAQGRATISYDSKALRAWDGYCLNLFGCAVIAQHEPPWPQWGEVFSEDEGAVQIWRLRAYRPDAYAFAEIRWPTEVGVSKRIHVVAGWELLKPKEQDRAVLGAAGGMRAIEEILRHPGGRPDGGEFPDERTFRARVEPVVRDLRAKRGRATLEDVATKIGREPRDLRRLCRRRTGLDWPTFVSGVI
jgi:hypothetical protein